MTTATLDGELTLARTSALLREVRTLAAAGVIDLGGVTRVDSAGLAFLLELTRHARQQNHTLHWRNAPPALTSLAAFFGLSGILRFDAATETSP